MGSKDAILLRTRPNQRGRVTDISRMHKFVNNCKCDITVIFLYVHKISTWQKAQNLVK